jgi:hypothetical protein
MREIVWRVERPHDQRLFRDILQKRIEVAPQKIYDRHVFNIIWRELKITKAG